MILRAHHGSLGSIIANSPAAGMDHQSLMIHLRKLVVRPINVSDWIFDIRVNPFVRHLIKVLKGSAAIAGQSCPPSGLNRVLSSPWARCSLLPWLLLSSFPIFILHCSESATLNQSLPGVGGTAWLSGRGIAFSRLPVQEAQASGSWLASRLEPHGACPSSGAVSRYQSLSHPSHSSSWELGSL